ncbi:hypothetical protein ACNO8X_00715 [Mycobacterium sp. PDNC021]|uniref:hypothetical protein n=1 Tax=Mycobacterium sp. PDNC021 TaxID=3391399 RepID=UPI003AB0825A
MATFKKIALITALAGSIGAALLGVGAGAAGAAPSQDSAVIPMDRGHGHDDWDDHGRGWGGPGWRGGGWDGPRVYVNLPCVTGPAGFVTVCP